MDLLDRATGEITTADFSSKSNFYVITRIDSNIETHLGKCLVCDLNMFESKI